MCEESFVVQNVVISVAVCRLGVQLANHYSVVRKRKEETDMDALKAENEKLRAEVAELRARVAEQQARPRIEHMSAEVVDSNPYR